SRASPGIPARSRSPIPSLRLLVDDSVGMSNRCVPGRVAMSFGACQSPLIMLIAVDEFISLDGVVQAPGGAEEDTDGGFRHGGWSMQFFDPEVMGPEFDEMAQRTDALLYGRRTWRVMADAWPGRAGDPFADWINGVQKYVVTNTLTDA